MRVLARTRVELASLVAIWLTVLSGLVCGSAGVARAETLAEWDPCETCQSIESSDKFSFEVYGFAQVDYIQDFNRVNPNWAATLRPSRIPTLDGLFGADGESILSAR